MSYLFRSETMRAIMRLLLRSLSNVGMVLFAVYSIHLARRSFGPRPKVLSRQFRPSAITDLSDPKRSSLRKLLGDVSPNSEARIYRSLTGVGSEEPTTTVARLQAAAGAKPKSAAFMIPDFDSFEGTTMKWKRAVTWDEYWQTSRQIAKSLIALGFKRHDTALFASESRPEFFMAWMGVQAAGGICVSVHPWNVKSQLKRLAEQSSPRVAFVDSPVHVESLSGVQGLERIVLISKQTEFEQMTLLGKTILDATLDDFIRGIKPGHGSTVLFSSGQSSDNRPILLSHDNVTFSARAFLQHHENVSRWGTRHPFDSSQPYPGEEKNTEHIVSFLPLSHVGTLVLDLHVPMCLTSFKSYGAACTVWTLHKSPSHPHKRDTLYPALVSVRPTIFVGMPAVWERFRRVLALPDNLLLRQALQLGSAWFNAVQAGSHGTEPVGLYYAERFVFSQIKKRLGLDRAKLLMSSGAPIAKDQLEFFGTLGMHIMESFGATGCSGPQTMGRQDYFVCGNVGVSLPSCELKIVPVKEYPGEDGEGEICIRGRHVCTGVLNNPEATNAIIDENGFFHTNHVGRLDAYGCLELIGRVDELVGHVTEIQSETSPRRKSSTRERRKKKKLGLGHIEAVVRDRARPLVDRVVVVDVKDAPKSCSLRVFCTLRRELIEGGNQVSTTDKGLLRKIHDAIEAANRTFDGVCHIDHFMVLPSNVRFTAFGDEPELTYTGQARRSVVMRKFQAELRVLTSDNYDSWSQQ